MIKTIWDEAKIVSDQKQVNFFEIIINNRKNINKEVMRCAI